jgi:hypothetical protein
VTIYCRSKLANKGNNATYQKYELSVGCRYANNENFIATHTTGFTSYEDRQVCERIFLTMCSAKERHVFKYRTRRVQQQTDDDNVTLRNVTKVLAQLSDETA